MPESTAPSRSTGAQHAHLYELLTTEVQRLTQQLNAIYSETAGLHADRTGHDSVDDGIVQADVDHAGQLADLTQRHLGAATAAIERIDAGTYGVCEGCGRLIDPARL